MQQQELAECGGMPGEFCRWLCNGPATIRVSKESGRGPCTWLCHIYIQAPLRPAAAGSRPLEQGAYPGTETCTADKAQRTPEAQDGRCSPGVCVRQSVQMEEEDPRQSPVAHDQSLYLRAESPGEPEHRAAILTCPSTPAPMWSSA